MVKSKKVAPGAKIGGSTAVENALSSMESGQAVDEVVPFHKIEKKKEMTRAEKEWIFIVKKIETRLKHLHLSHFEVCHIMLFVHC